MERVGLEDRRCCLIRKRPLQVLITIQERARSRERKRVKRRDARIPEVFASNRRGTLGSILVRSWEDTRRRVEA
ncbi:hypothetical protein KM043_003381 [Ampulex compressa]|nr:hypothetical protein KM043_003381 [Ampulex compressa]